MMRMPVDLVAEYWNDALTIAAFLTTCVLVFYQVRYYREQRPKIRIRSIEDARYFPTTANELNEYVKASLDDDLTGTEYVAYIELEKSGVRPAKVISVSLELEESISFSTRGDLAFDAPDVSRKYFSGRGDVRSDWPDEVTGVVTVEWTEGVEKERVTFDLETSEE